MSELVWGLDHSMTHEVVGSCQGETRMPEHISISSLCIIALSPVSGWRAFSSVSLCKDISISPAEEGWTVANDNETCLVVALNCNVLQHCVPCNLDSRLLISRPCNC
jgi:hypothetical protein